MPRLGLVVEHEPDLVAVVRDDLRGDRLEQLGAERASVVQPGGESHGRVHRADRPAVQVGGWERGTHADDVGAAACVVVQSGVSPAGRGESEGRRAAVDEGTGQAQGHLTAGTGAGFCG